MWSDEFNGDSLDTSKWVYRTDSKHWSTQLPQNVSLRDGRLILAVKKEEAGSKHYTGSGVISKEAFRYGYYEARFKVPPGAGWCGGTLECNLFHSASRFSLRRPSARHPMADMCRRSHPEYSPARCSRRH